MDCDGTGRLFLHLFITDMLHYRQDKANAVFGLPTSTSSRSIKTRENVEKFRSPV